MKNNYFLLPVNLSGEQILLKSRKCDYSVNRTIYKVSLPSTISESPICWIAEDGNNWNTVLGKPNAQLNNSLIEAIFELERAEPAVVALPKKAPRNSFLSRIHLNSLFVYLTIYFIK